MNVVVYTRAVLWSRRWSVGLQWLMLLIGFTLLLFIYRLNESSEEQLVADVAPVDQVWAPNGSSLEALLAHVYHIESANGTLSESDVTLWLEHPLVSEYCRIAHGDYAFGYRILGSDSSLYRWYSLELQSGKWPVNTYETAVSEQTAARLGLRLGDSFNGQHHQEDDGAHGTYTISGIFANGGTVMDQLILTPLHSVWDVHQIEDSVRTISAVLIKTKSTMAMFQLPRMIREKASFQVVLPSIEVNRIRSAIGSSKALLYAFSILIAAFGLMSFAMAMWTQMNKQKADYLLLRTLGMPASRLIWIPLWQAVFVTVSAWFVALLGISLGQWFWSGQILSEFGIRWKSQLWTSFDLSILIVSLVLSFLVILPLVVKLYKSSLHKFIRS